MKVMIAIYAMLMATLALPLDAPTTLTPQSCVYVSVNGTGGTCYNVGNSEGSAIPLFQFNRSFGSTITIDGMDYAGEVFPASNAFVNSPFVADDGSVVYVSASFTLHSKLVRSGHNYYKHWWTLDSGAIS